MPDKKISDFVQQVSFESTDSLNIVRNGTNFKVPFSAVAGALGTTGSLATAGTTGVPVLLQPTSTINKIRNVDSGNGVIVNVGVDDQLIFSQNIVVDSTGSAIIVDKNISAPVYRSIVADAGATVTTDGNTIKIGATGVQEQNLKIINSLEDFPAAAGGVITLADDTNYIIAASITTSNRFVMGKNNAFTSNNTFSPTLTYTGVGAMFTGVNVNCEINEINLSCSTATVFDFSASVGTLVRVLLRNVVVETCNKWGVFDELRVLTIDVCSYAGVEGMTISGSNNWSALACNQFGMFTTNPAFIGIDLGASVHRTLELNNLIVIGVSGSVGIKGAANSANMLTNELGMVTGGTFSGGITPLDTITSNDLRWAFSDNTNIKDTLSDALLSLNTNALETVISTSNTPVLVNAVWTCVRESKFTCSTAGRATYTGERGITTPVDISAGVISAGGGSITVTVYLALNGVVIDDSKVPLAISGSNAAITPIFWQLDLVENDYLEVFVENNTNTTNIIVEHAKLRVN